MNEREIKERLIKCGWNKLTREQAESVVRFTEILYEMKDLPLEQQQEIIDNIQDPIILKFLEDEKKKMS